MTLSRFVDTFAALGDENRLRLCALLRDRELCVTDLVRVTGMAQSRVSTHLGRLREAGFVLDRRQGAQSFYTLATQSLPVPARVFIEEAAASTDPTLAADHSRLLELEAERRGGLPESVLTEMERFYSPGRTWQSLAVGLAALLRLGDVLDVGAGDGAVAGSIAPYCRSLTCIDVDAHLVDMARDRLAHHPQVTVQCADVHQLPFRDASFDTVLMFHTLTYAEHPGRALQECARVLRSNGRLVVLCLNQHEQQELTAPYGERHAGFAPRALRALLGRAGLQVTSAEIACREAKRPHLEVVLAIADKVDEPSRAPSRDRSHEHRVRGEGNASRAGAAKSSSQQVAIQEQPRSTSRKTG